MVDIQSLCRSAVDGKSKEVRIPCPECGKGDKDTSLAVSPEKSVYHCHRCGLSGNFIEKPEKKEFKPLPQWIYEQGIVINGQGHPYLTKKGVPAHPLFRLSISPKFPNSLIIPAFPIGSSEIQTLQFIPEKPDEKGKFPKFFKKDIEKIGTCFPISEYVKAEKIYLCEGITTGLSIDMAIGGNGSAVICCFDKGNLMPVAKKLREIYRDRQIFICADNDKPDKIHSDFGGGGLAKAREASAAIGAGVFFPSIPGTDFNDVHTRQSLDAIREILAGKPEYPKSFFDAFKDATESDIAYPFQPEVIGKIREIFKVDKAEYLKIRVFLKGQKDFSLSLWEKEITKKKEKNSMAVEKSVETTPEVPYVFWYWDSKREAIRISTERVFDFILKNGFCKAKFTGDKKFYRVENNRIETAEIGDCREYVMDYLMGLPENNEQISSQDLRGVWTSGIAKYLNDPLFQSLPTKDISFHSDSLDKTFFYFADSVCQVNAEEIKAIPYSDISGTIWKSEVLANNRGGNYDIDTRKHPFSIFLDRICTKNKAIDAARRESLETVIGFLLNRYNDPAYAKAVIFTDGNMDDDPNGGSGKSIIWKAINHVRKCTDINGQGNEGLKSDKFYLQRVESDTRIVVIEDAEKNFKFENFFNMITEGFQVEQKREKQVRFTPAMSPKLLITTNYAVKGTGGSHDRRKFEMELHPHFNAKNPPCNDPEIGRLFVNWDSELWQGFFAILANCACKFHQNSSSMKAYNSETLDSKKLRFEVGVSFVEFAQDIPLNTPVIAAALMEQYKEGLSKREQDFVNNTNFGRKIKAFCEACGYTLETNRKGTYQGKNNQLQYIFRADNPEVEDDFDS